jgi:hypothetical protein
MLSKTECLQKVDALRDDIRAMTDIDEPAMISETAARLKGLNYTPPVSVSLDTFLSFSTSGLLDEIDRISNLPDDDMAQPEGSEELGPWAIKLEHISVLVFYFKELAELRRGVGEAWDEVDELYVHD